jgi:hypothetical protein
MSAPRVDALRIHDHVVRLGDKHPPIDLSSADYTTRDADEVRRRFAGPLAFMARVEMEVERNVLELAMMLPGVSETDRLFYQDVWAPQEQHHGVLLDTLVQRLDLPAVTTVLEPSRRIRLLGALAHVPAVQEVIRLLYYLTGAATEKSAIIAYQAMGAELGRMGETALEQTVIGPIKVQEPGHFAFYRMSAQEMVQTGVLAPWQLATARLLRSKAFSLVGVATADQQTEFGGVMVALGLDEQLERTVRDITLVEQQLLWAEHKGMTVPGYALRAFREAIESFRERPSAPVLAA